MRHVRNIAICDYQESVTDRWTDARQSDPYVCFAGDIINSDAVNAYFFCNCAFITKKLSQLEITSWRGYEGKLVWIIRIAIPHNILMTQSWNLPKGSIVNLIAQIYFQKINTPLKHVKMLYKPLWAICVGSRDELWPRHPDIHTAELTALRLLCQRRSKSNSRTSHLLQEIGQLHIKLAEITMSCWLCPHNISSICTLHHHLLSCYYSSHYYINITFFTGWHCRLSSRGNIVDWSSCASVDNAFWGMTIYNVTL